MRLGRKRITILIKSDNACRGIGPIVKPKCRSSAKHLRHDDAEGVDWANACNGICQIARLG
jgi:hypothetical protein